MAENVESGAGPFRHFLEAQAPVYGNVLEELRRGRKESHWMWFVFPQLAGLGHSPTAQFFALASRDEAGAYLRHPLLGSRLRQCVEALAQWAGERRAEQMLGPVDAMKLRSSLTLFDRLEPGGVFERALLEFFEGNRDQLTLALLDQRR
jgi:uncharacterized protein (DUF1810 family)